MLLVQSCAQDNTVDLREKEYGYVQFKLYKEASYTPATKSSRADKPLDYLADACKVEVTIAPESGPKLRQTLVLSASDSDAAEFGLRSDKLKLLAGKYTLTKVVLYDVLDNDIYTDSDISGSVFTVLTGGLVQHDVAVDVVERGKVKFTLVKDLSDFTQTPTVRSGEEEKREYTFDEIKAVNLTLMKVNAAGETYGREIQFEKLPAKFSQHFDEDNLQNSNEGWKTSSIECDTLLSLEAAKYRVIGYKTYASKKDIIPLEEFSIASNEVNAEHDFVVTDNETTNAKVYVKLHEADEYIKDNYALYAIWKSLDGENWCYDGESYARGTNWDFNKDVDLWCEQPGVQVYSNGRIARIDLSGFGIRGEMSPAIGQLTELAELYLGTHNDTNIIYDPLLDFSRPLAERQRNRFDDQRKYLHSIHPAIQMSEPCARALMEKGLTSPAMALYEQGCKESDIIDHATGRQKSIGKYDMNHGTLVNGLKSLPKEIGKLKKLSILFIANGELESLPDEIVGLVSLTDIEIYNCPKMTKFPMVIAQLPALKSVNISNNKQWSSEEMNKGFTALARGASRKTIEIIYARQNNLTEFTKKMFGAESDTEGGLEKIGLLDLAFNKISKVEAPGKEVAFTQLYLDNNQIESLPRDSKGYFCDYDDVETFSVNYNKLTKIPNIFNAESDFTMTSVSFGGNQITGCEDGENYKGIKVKTLTLSLNPLVKYPKEFATSNSSFEYLVASACQIEEIEEGSFSHERAINHFSFDLSYNRLKKLPKDWHAGNMPYLYGVDLSFNRFEDFPWNPLDSESLTVLAVRSQRNEKGERCLRKWPQGIYQHRGLRGLYLGSNDLRNIDDTISTLCYYLDISDNPNIIFDASDICYAWQVGAYILYYDKTQKILNCDAMLE